MAEIGKNMIRGPGRHQKNVIEAAAGECRYSEKIIHATGECYARQHVSRS